MGHSVKDCIASEKDKGLVQDCLLNKLAQAEGTSNSTEVQKVLATLAEGDLFADVEGIGCTKESQLQEEPVHFVLASDVGMGKISPNQVELQRMDVVSRDDNTKVVL
ncbi:hypothetical protein SUGI_0179150 [Cryptomeria japonica]|nr:hypothetical protein SUGI_0179150 [Cryptomeria japonica]